MSYTTDLDQMDERDLLEEISRRRLKRAEGRCDYCGRPFDSKPCRMTERHERCGAVSKARRGVPDGQVCTAPRGHPPGHHHSERGAGWSTDEASR